MKKIFTQHWQSPARAVLMILLAITFQVSMAQDYDFEQDVELNVVMEAENYTEYIAPGLDEWLQTQEPANYSGEGGMLAVSSGPFATAEDAMASSPMLIYSIYFYETGPHYIWARAAYSADNRGGTDSYHAGLDESIPESGTFLNFEETFGDTVEGNWMWINWSNPIGGQAYVDVGSVGVHEFVVYIRENGLSIDKFVLTPIPYDDGFGFGPPADTIAETTPATGLIRAELDPDALSFFPNPAGEQIQVRIGNGGGAMNRIGFYDITGKLVRSVPADRMNSIRIDVGDLNSGVYYLKLEQNGSITSVQKMLKL